MNNEDFVKKVESLGDCDGDLCLLIGCTKCPATFEINAQAIIIAELTHASVLDYILYIQNSKCKVCNKE